LSLRIHAIILQKTKKGIFIVFSNILNKWATSIQRKEIKEFICNLKVMDSQELGFVVAVATDIRHRLESEGHVLMDPISYVALEPQFPHFLSSTIVRLQKQGQPVDAAGMMIWAHTFRAANRLELRGLGREMWGELERGFPYIEESASGFMRLTGKWLDISGANSFPIGLSPKPL
jgi:hypothetical protein